jgi:hypothetical protein
VRKRSAAGPFKRGVLHLKPVALSPSTHVYLLIVLLIAGVIHGDFEKGFIKAEVVAYQDFHDLCEGGKSMGPIKAAGKYRQEGKTVSPSYSGRSSRRVTCTSNGMSLQEKIIDFMVLVREFHSKQSFLGWKQNTDRLSAN